MIKTIVIIAIGTIVFTAAAVQGIGHSIDNQDIMLCTSAKVSGNEDYLTKCACYYRTSDIHCIQH